MNFYLKLIFAAFQSRKSEEVPIQTFQLFWIFLLERQSCSICTFQTLRINLGHLSIERGREKKRGAASIIFIFQSGKRGAYFFHKRNREGNPFLGSSECLMNNLRKYRRANRVISSIQIG